MASPSSSKDNGVNTVPLDQFNIYAPSSAPQALDLYIQSPNDLLEMDKTNPRFDRSEIIVPQPTVETENENINASPLNKNTDDESGDDDESINDPCDEEELTGANVIVKPVMWLQKSAAKVMRRTMKLTRGYLFKVIFLIAYFAYFITAMCHRTSDEGAHRLIGCTVFGVLIVIRHRLFASIRWICRKVYGAKQLSPYHETKYKTFKFFFGWIMNGALCAIVMWMLIDQAIEDIENLRSLPGLIIFLLLCFLFSTRPDKINWHTIYWSIGLQFLLAYFALKWTFGRRVILWIQDRFDEFFENTHGSSDLLFGYGWREHALMFNGFPTTFYTSATLALLYYLGAIQVLINALGKFFNLVLQTSYIESTCVAISIFTEGIPTLLLAKPFFDSLSKSQMFTIITTCFSSLGGTYLAILTAFGASLEYIIPAMVISAPANIAVTKLLLPEVKPIDNEKEKDVDICETEKKKYVTVLDALQLGALSVTKVVITLIVVSFVFIAVIDWFNHTFMWFGDRVGVDDFTLEYTSSYLLYPVSLALGVERGDCRRVATLLGYRIFFNALIAFIKLGELKGNKFQFLNYMAMTNGTGLVSHDDQDIILSQWNQTLTNGFISDRSEAIITYTLCGYSSITSAAAHMAILYTMLPKRRRWLTKIAVPAIIAGNVANCMTGCFASFFFY